MKPSTEVLNSVPFVILLENEDHKEDVMKLSQIVGYNVDEGEPEGYGSLIVIDVLYLVVVGGVQPDGEKVHMEFVYIIPIPCVYLYYCVPDSQSCWQTKAA